MEWVDVQCGFGSAPGERLAVTAEALLAEMERINNLPELAPIFARHGVTINRAALEDPERSLLDPRRRPRPRGPLTRMADDLGQAVKRIDAALKAGKQAS